MPSMLRSHILLILVMAVAMLCLVRPTVGRAAAPDDAKAPKAAVPNASASSPAPAPANASAAITAKIPLDIQSQGADAAGALLGFKLKEAAMGSAFFALTPDGKRFVLRLVSKPEFPDRPKLSSVYAVALYFQEAPDVLPYFLDLRPGVVDADTAQAETQALLDWAANTAKKFNFLLSN